MAGTGTLNVIDDGSVNFGSGLAMAVDKGSSGYLTIASGGSVEVKKALWVGGAPNNPDGAALVNVGSGGSLTVNLGLHVGDGSAGEPGRRNHHRGRGQGQHRDREGRRCDRIRNIGRAGRAGDRG